MQPIHLILDLTCNNTVKERKSKGKRVSKKL